MQNIIKQKAKSYSASIAQNEERAKYCEEDFAKGAEWMQEVIINKACKYLEKHLFDYWSQKITDPTKFINEIRKAMEE